MFRHMSRCYARPAWPREESNLRTQLRRLPLYPLSYGAWRAKRSPLLCRGSVAVAQLVELRVVVPVAAGSSPVRHLETTGPRRAAPLRTRSGRHALAGEDPQHLAIESGDVVRLPARDEVAVDDDLLVDPVAAGVADVRLEGRPRGDALAAHDPRLDEHPRAVADDRHRLPGLLEPAHEGDGVLVAAQLVRVADAARNQERVVVVGRDLVDRAVDLDRVRRVEVVEALDLAVFERDDLDLCAGVLECLPRLLELDPLEHVGSEDRDLLALQHVSHWTPPWSVSVSQRLPGTARPMRSCGGGSPGTAARRSSSRSHAGVSPAARTSGRANGGARRAIREAARTRRGRPAPRGRVG